MKKRIVFVLLTFLLPSSAQANPLKKFYHWAKTHRLELVADGFMMAAGAIDQQQTLAAERRCPGCRETQIGMAGRPSQADEWKVDAVEWPIELTINHFGYRIIHGEPGTTFEKNTWVIFPVSIVAWHTYGAIHNAGIKATK